MASLVWGHYLQLSANPNQSNPFPFNFFVQPDRIPLTRPNYAFRAYTASEVGSSSSFFFMKKQEARSSHALHQPDSTRHDASFASLPFPAFDCTLVRFQRLYFVLSGQMSSSPRYSLNSIKIGRLSCMFRWNWYDFVPIPAGSPYPLRNSNFVKELHLSILPPFPTIIFNPNVRV